MLGAGHRHALGHVHALLPGLVVARGVLVQVEQVEVQRELQSSLVVQGVDPLAAAAAIPLQLGEQGARHLGKKGKAVVVVVFSAALLDQQHRTKERKKGVEWRGREEKEKRPDAKKLNK